MILDSIKVDSPDHADSVPMLIETYYGGDERGILFVMAGPNIVELDEKKARRLRDLLTHFLENS